MIIMLNRIKLLKELEKYPVFTINIVSGITKKEKPYTRLIIHRLKKAGLIYELERDRYTLHYDPLLVASHILWPCYISSWAAIRYYNLTEQLPTMIEVITTRPKEKKEIKFAGAKIRFSRIKIENLFGYGKVSSGSYEIFMAEKEKALADALYLRQMTFQTFLEIVNEHKKEINIRKLVSYLKKMKLLGTVLKLKEAGL